MSRSYGQLCGLALALDAVGDRWSMLIVRELLVRPEGARYTDLRDGLPGIATNLLADRLRSLEEAGVLRREGPQPPVATPVFRLTDDGRALLPAVEALAVWGGRFVPRTPREAEFRTRWMRIPVEAMLTDHQPDEPATVVEVRTGDEPLTITAEDGHVHARTGAPARPADVVITGPAKPILGMVARKLPVASAPSVGVEIVGDLSALERIGLGPGTAGDPAQAVPLER